MKALILSGGRGTRLRPITHTGAKQLVPVANKPILYYAIESIVKAGITDIGIITGDTFREIEDACGDGSHWGALITYIHQDEPLGLAHAVMVARPFLKDSPFVMYLGDNLVVDGIASFVQDFQDKQPDALILLAQVKHPQDFGVATLNQGRVVKLEEKPANPQSNYALVGVYLFGTAIHAAVSAIKPSKRGEYEITDAIQYLIDNGQDVQSYEVRGWWKDTGNLEDMLETNRLVLEASEGKVDGSVDAHSQLIGKVQLASGARVVNSVIRGPAVIGQDTLIENAYVGPFTSIYFGCTLKNCEIEHSIVLENSSIVDIQARIEDSLIGKNVRVRKTDAKPKAYRLMLGDNSEVGII